MARKAEEYIVGILFAYEDRTEIKYVTEIDMQTKFAKWEDGKEAMTFSKDWAKDLAWALSLNGNTAIPMIKADYLDLVNPEKEREEEKFLEIYREDYTEGQFNEMLASLGLNNDEVGDAFMFKGTVVKSTLKNGDE